ncbi:hypothetical protein C8P68_104101 [Mucilaginibacter yixingensis]|uniref:O-antigen ligase-related domain-containing protein n=1 Tax=Mucilaginibacter yixingensis TaxID=1295612 RepID=A0A2T5J985_9SPHI|nr:O-antigen ligase family protein [Mucilaginibacter yixingensis]PTQ96616.1 hypothetical protein C8P68_104101 [Mucilaginibacter yixingensis]
MISNKEKTWAIPVVMGLTLTGFGVAVYFGSRAFALGYLCALCLLLVPKFKQQKAGVWLMGLLVIAALLICSCLIKVDSSLGRVLIYKIAWPMFTEHWLQGIGLHHFNLFYMRYQAHYFATGNYAVKEMLLADNVAYAYNDYFQLMVECGVIGGLLLLFAVWGVYKLLSPVFGNREQATFLELLSAVQLMAMLVAACFTFVFYQWYYLAVLVLCLTICTIGYLSRSALKFKNIWLTGVAGLAALCLIWIGTVALRCYHEEQDFSATKDLAFAGFKNEALADASGQLAHLAGNDHFLTLYGDLLYEMKRYRQAEAIYRQLSKRITYNDLYLKLANCYAMTGQDSLAIAFYQDAVAMVPNRFGSKFDLFKFYLKKHDQVNAVRLSRQILYQPVKIPSAQIDLIKNQTLQLQKEQR